MRVAKITMKFEEERAFNDPSKTLSRRFSARLKASLKMDAVDEAIEADLEMGPIEADVFCGPELPPAPEGGWYYLEPIKYSPGGNRYFKKGVHLLPMVKLLLLQVANGIRRVWSCGNRRMRRIPQNQTWTQFLRGEFKEITGFDYRRFYEYQAEARKNQGYLLPPEDRGRKPIILEAEVGALLLSRFLLAQISFLPLSCRVRRWF